MPPLPEPGRRAFLLSERSWFVGAESRIKDLETTRITELRQLWRARFKFDSPPAFGPDLLRRSLQEEAYGGMSPQQAGAQPPHQQIETGESRTIKDPAGAVLVRQWKDQAHQVMVLEEALP